MVASAGIEPATLGLVDRYSAQLSYEATRIGGAGRVRTDYIQINSLAFIPMNFDPKAKPT